MYDRNWFSPVSLTREYPVTQLIVYSCTSDSSFFDDMWSFFLKDRTFHAIPLSGVDHCSGCFCVSFCHIFDFFSVFCNNLNDRNVELGCKFKVTVIMSRYAHDCSCTVISQYIIRKPDRYFCSVQRVDCISSCKYTCFFFVLQTVYVRLHRRIEDIFFYFFFVFRCCKLCCKFVFRCKYHEGCSMKSIWSCCVYGNLFIFSFYREIYFCTVTLTDPFCLHLFNFFRPVKLIKII